jgi:hypothetical protein
VCCIPILYFFPYSFSLFFPLFLSLVHLFFLSLASPKARLTRRPVGCGGFEHDGIVWMYYKREWYRLSLSRTSSVSQVTGHELHRLSIFGKEMFISLRPRHPTHLLDSW